MRFILMKLRLEALQITDEDMDIYVRMAGHFRKHGYRVIKIYDVADRRDADIMLEREVKRTRGWLRLHEMEFQERRRVAIFE